MNASALPPTRGADADAIAGPDQALHAALAPEVRDRLQHLFRATLAEGRIHPLYLPVLRYRHAQAQSQAQAGA